MTDDELQRRWDMLRGSPTLQESRTTSSFLARLLQNRSFYVTLIGVSAVIIVLIAALPTLMRPPTVNRWLLPQRPLMRNLATVSKLSFLDEFDWLIEPDFIKSSATISSPNGVSISGTLTNSPREEALLGKEHRFFLLSSLHGMTRDGISLVGAGTFQIKGKSLASQNASAPPRFRNIEWMKLSLNLTNQSATADSITIVREWKKSD